MSGDVSRLPKWAQEHIARLEAELQRRDVKIAELCGEYPDSNVKVSGHCIYPDITLPSGTSVDFYMSESREKHRQTFTVHHNRYDSGILEVMGPSEGIAVHPRSSNVVYLKAGGF